VMPDAKGSNLERLAEVIRKLEVERKSRIWCIAHMGSGHICGPMMYALYAARDKIGTGDKMELLLHSPGGDPQIAFITMKFFRRRFKQVNVIVPLFAKSSATLMCLGADKVYMGEFAELGPIDIQINDAVEHGVKSFSPLDEFKSIEFMREQAIEWMHFYAMVMLRRYGMSLKDALHDSVPLVCGLLGPMFQRIDPLEVGEHRRALAIGEEYAERMLALTGNSNAKEIIKRVVWEYPSHDFSIDFEEAQEIKLPVYRLSETEDRQLTEAIMQLGKDDTYHGFAAQQAPTSRTQRQPVQSTRRKSVRKRRSREGTNGRVRLNGSNAVGAQERL
jgi:hypothetical protein